MVKRLQKIGALLVLVLLLSTHATAGAASEVGSIGILPAFPKAGNTRSKSIFIHNIKGGETVDDGVLVYNNTKESRTVKVDAVDSTIASDGSFSCKQNSEKKTAVGSWIRLSRHEVTVPAESNEQVSFTISAPKDASPGEHGGCITAQDTKNMGSQGGKGIILGFRNAIRVAITVPGELIKKLTITKIEISRNEKGNYTVSPVSHNGGNVSLDVTSRVQLSSIFGRRSPVKTATYPVMAGATTGWAFEFKQPFWGGIYKARTSIAYDASTSSGIGDTVRDEQKTRKDTGYFVMIPTTRALVIEGAALILLICLLVVAWRRRSQRRKARKYTERYTVQEGDTLSAIAERRRTKWKRIARVNKLKAPYVLVAGQMLYVPKSRSTNKKRHRSDDWVTGESAEATQAVSPKEQPDDIHAQPAVDNYDWVSPRDASPQPSHGASSRTPNPVFPEPEETGVLDWREGASEDELRDLGVLQDSAAVPTINRSWGMDEEKRVVKKLNKSDSKTPAKRKRRKT